MWHNVTCSIAMLNYQRVSACWPFLATSTTMFFRHFSTPSSIARRRFPKGRHRRRGLRGPWEKSVGNMGKITNKTGIFIEPLLHICLYVWWVTIFEITMINGYIKKWDLDIYHWVLLSIQCGKMDYSNWSSDQGWIWKLKAEHHVHKFQEMTMYCN